MCWIRFEHTLKNPSGSIVKIVEGAVLKSRHGENWRDHLGQKASLTNLIGYGRWMNEWLLCLRKLVENYPLVAQWVKDPATAVARVRSLTPELQHAPRETKWVHLGKGSKDVERGETQIVLPCQPKYLRNKVIDRVMCYQEVTLGLKTSTHGHFHCIAPQ